MKVAVLGAGIMGSGIAQLSAMAGHDVAVRDIDDPALDRGRKAVEFSLGKLVEKGRMAAEEADAVRGRLTWTTDLAESVADVDVVVEAVPEMPAHRGGVMSQCFTPKKSALYAAL